MKIHHSMKYVAALLDSMAIAATPAHAKHGMGNQSDKNGKKPDPA